MRSVADFINMVQASMLASLNEDSRYSIMTTGSFDRCTPSYTKRHTDRDVSSINNVEKKQDGKYANTTPHTVLF